MEESTAAEGDAPRTEAVDGKYFCESYLYTGVIAVLLLVAVASIFALPWPHNVFAMLLGWTMLAIAVADMLARIIPDVLSLPAIPAGLLLSGNLYDTTTSELVALDHVVALCAASCSFAALRYAYRRLRDREGLGLGDVKLAAAAGAWTGTNGVCDVILFASLSALAVFYVKRLFDTDMPPLGDVAIPFGAFLAPAIWLVWSLQRVSFTPFAVYGP